MKGERERLMVKMTKITDSYRELYDSRMVSRVPVSVFLDSMIFENNIDVIINVVRVSFLITHREANKLSRHVLLRIQDRPRR
jgi:hypothetical protein